MPAFLFNFKPKFVVAVEYGKKNQTIRANRQDGKRPQPGDTLKLYTGLRTRATRLLREVRCLTCVGVRMYFQDGLLTVDGRQLNGRERTQFAQDDGFANWPEMLAWFKDQYGETDVFEGFCVTWPELSPSST